ncbi:MAG: hypothetical protein EBR40_00275 [Proteobacteria bacterium]|nr:hypothetical protein [Pseudomonadota bacterium]
MRTARRHPGLPTVVLLVLTAVLLLGAGAGFLMLSRWVQSEECHALLESKASEALAGKAEFGPLEWLWVGVASPQVKAFSGDGARPHSMEAGNVRARLRLASLLQGCWAVEEISMEKARLHFAAAVPAKLKEDAPASSRHSPAPLRLPSWIPSVLVVEAIRSSKTDLLFDLPDRKMLELLGTKLEVYPGKTDFRLEAHGGAMVWTQFPGFQPDLLWARGRLSEGRLRINGAELGFSGGGSAGFEGEFPDPDGVSHIKLHCKGLPISDVFPTASAMVSGTISGEGTASWTPLESRSMEGSVAVDDASVHSVPALDELAAFTGMKQFRNLSLKKASASFVRAGNVTRWREIILEAPGVLKVTGEAEVGDNGSLAGTLQAGVTTDIVRVIPMAKELLSAEEREGYFWIPVHVGGSLEHPTEDLRPRLVTAIAAKASGVIRGGIEEGLKILGIKSDSTNGSILPAADTNTVKSLEKEAGSVIEAVGNFLK